MLESNDCVSIYLKVLVYMERCKYICENETANSGIIESVSIKYYSNCKSIS